MYFLKKNALNIIICILIFGVIGTLINLAVPAQSYEYEEYYTIDGEVSPNTGSALNAVLNENVNHHFARKVVNVSHDQDSNILQVNISAADAEGIDSIKAQTDDLLAQEGYTVIETDGANMYQDENEIVKITIIAISLFIGLLIGLIIAVLNKNISTDEDFEHYLDEKILGTF